MKEFDKAVQYADGYIDNQIKYFAKGLEFLTEEDVKAFKSKYLGDFSLVKSTGLNTTNYDYNEKLLRLSVYEKGLLLSNNVALRLFVYEKGNEELKEDYQKFSKLQKTIPQPTV